jgi:hypothetical protein
LKNYGEVENPAPSLLHHFHPLSLAHPLSHRTRPILQRSKRFVDTRRRRLPSVAVTTGSESRC